MGPYRRPGGPLRHPRRRTARIQTHKAGQTLASEGREESGFHAVQHHVRDHETEHGIDDHGDPRLEPELPFSHERIIAQERAPQPRARLQALPDAR